MSRSDMMARLLRLARLAERSERTGESAHEAIGQDEPGDLGRRDFAKTLAAATVAAATWSVAPGAMAAAAGTGGMDRRTIGPRIAGNVAVVGAGLAGLSCSYELARHGINARVFEGSDRVGGRCSSLRGVFPGQVVEQGGEFFTGAHHTMVGYARQFGLELERYSQLAGDNYYYFGGQRYTEAQVIEEYKAFANSMREDLRTLSHPTADSYTENDALFDFMSLDDYLGLHGASPLLRGLIGSAYRAEYGAGIDELSAITFLRFAQSDKRSKLSPFGVHSGAMLRVADGNDRITSALADRLPTPVSLGHRLVAVRKLSNGKLRLAFETGGRSIQRDYDAVVLTLPFSVLRDVDLHPSLELPDWKLRSIANASMGDHSKLLVGFNQPVWQSAAHGLTGTGFSDRNLMGSTWAANPSRSGPGQAVLASYVGGTQARGMTAATTQADANSFLGNLEQVLPGAKAAAARDSSGNLLARTANWSSNPWSRGSQSCNRPGYFTNVAQTEGKAVGNLLFAGEHTSSFYEWQGFMEGAALSGLRTAGEVLELARA
jgi:monoamine oxidase